MVAVSHATLRALAPLTGHDLDALGAPQVQICCDCQFIESFAWCELSG